MTKGACPKCHYNGAALVEESDRLLTDLAEAVEIIQECDGVLQQLYDDDKLYGRINAFLARMKEKADLRGAYAASLEEGKE